MAKQKLTARSLELDGQDPGCRWIPLPQDPQIEEDLKKKPTGVPPDRFRSFLAGPENRLAEMVVHWILEGVPLASLAGVPALPPIVPPPGSQGTGRKKKSPVFQNSNHDFVPIQNIPYISPITFYGPAGSGKSLLIHGIHRALTELYPGSKIQRFTGTDFRHEWLEAMHFKQIDEFHDFFTSLDGLILEDLQELTDYEETLTELLSIISDCRHRKTLLLFSASEYPGLLRLPPGLAARLTGGLTVPLSFPSLESRRILLKQAADLNKTELDPDVLSILLKKLPESAGALLAGYNRILLQFQTGKIPLTFENLEDYFSDRENKNKCDLDKIARTAAAYFKISLSELRGQSRRKTTATARKITIYLGREMAGIKLQDLGRWFSGRNHSTALYAWREINAALTSDPALAEIVRKIQKSLENS